MTKVSALAKTEMTSERICERESEAERAYAAAKRAKVKLDIYANIL